MNVVKYNVLNKTTNKKLPYYENEYLIIPGVKKQYKYFLECSVYIKDEKRNQYYILLGIDKFDENCRRCSTNGYGSVKLKPQGEIKEYIENLCEESKNVNISYFDSEGGYDVYKFSE